LVEKVRQIKIFGEMYTLKAQVKVLNGFSSHADAHELRALTSPLARDCRHAFIVHGELDQAEGLAAVMRTDGYQKVTIPESGQSFDLN
jgi:metallo-beta-lactamase family protein